MNDPLNTKIMIVTCDFEDGNDKCENYIILASKYK